MPPVEPRPVTLLLRRWSHGDDGAREEVMPLVYDELRKLARSHLRREAGGHTLETSALVHEAFFRLVDQGDITWQNRRHFFGVAALAMRRILVDAARRRARDKRGGEAEQVSFDEQWHPALETPAEILALDGALKDLAELDPERAELVELRFFGGLTITEIAELWSASVSTVERRWRLARAFLHDALTSGGGERS